MEGVFMYFKFSLTHDNLVAETLWFGDLTYEIIATGFTSQNQWIVNNSNKLPLILVSDYSKASLNKVTEKDLRNMAYKYHCIESLFPDINWIAIMPDSVDYSIVRLWLDHAESLFISNAYVVRSCSRAKDIISNVLKNFRK